MNKKILVIGDSHVEQGQNLSRFSALGNFISKNPIDAVVSIGDFATVESLSAWDKDKRKQMENRRYEKEISACNEALDRLNIPKRVEKIYIEGNHEDRAKRFIDYHPELEGKISIRKDLDLDNRGWLWVPYKSNHTINGVSFTHVPISGNGKPISGVDVCGKALKLYHNSVVFGHNHGLYHSMEHRQNAPHLNQALSVGCFFEHVAEYALGSKTDYWRGVVVLDIYHKNRFNFTCISLSTLKQQYGK